MVIFNFDFVELRLRSLRDCKCTCISLACSNFQFSLFNSDGSFLRELRRLTSRRLYFAAAVVLPLFLLLFMCTIFGSGQMRHLPIGVVDADNTATSRRIVRHIAAVPTFDLVIRYANEAEARQAVQRKAIYGYLSIPPHFEADRQCGRDATLCYYYHYALLAVGGEVMSGFEQALIPVRMAPIVDEAVTLGGTEDDIEHFLLPLTADDHALYNPSLDYSVYLSLPIYYIMFQILVLLVTLYAIGCEARDGTSAAWLASARGNILVAVSGKLLPYTLLFIVEALLANAIFFHWLHIPMGGPAWLFALTVVLFVLATQAVAVILYALFPSLGIIISVVSMVGSLGATLSGLTFPLSAMSPVVQWAAHLLPVRHFTQAMQCMLYTDGGISACYPSLVSLCVFVPVALLLLPRLHRLVLSRRYETLS